MVATFFYNMYFYYKFLICANFLITVRDMTRLLVLLDLFNIEPSRQVSP